MNAVASSFSYIRTRKHRNERDLHHLVTLDGEQARLTRWAVRYVSSGELRRQRGVKLSRSYQPLQEDWGLECDL